MRRSIKDSRCIVVEIYFNFSEHWHTGGNELHHISGWPRIGIAQLVAVLLHIGFLMVKAEHYSYGSVEMNRLEWILNTIFESYLQYTT